MPSTLTPRHEANIVAKAQRGLDAIIDVVNSAVIPCSDFHCKTLLSGLEFMERALFNEPESREASAWWVAVGIQDQVRRGRTTARTVADITDFHTSRPYIAKMLAARIEAMIQAESATAADPFAGLEIW